MPYVRESSRGITVASYLRRWPASNISPSPINSITSVGSSGVFPTGVGKIGKYGIPGKPTPIGTYGGGEMVVGMGAITGPPGPMGGNGPMGTNGGGSSSVGIDGGDNGARGIDGGTPTEIYGISIIGIEGGTNSRGVRGTLLIRFPQRPRIILP